jgi:replication factor C subunit 3/5
VLKEIAQSVPLDDRRLFKMVVIKEVDRLSRGAQHALRKTMEKYMSTCRLVLYCNSTSKIIDPVQSRCMMIRVPAPRVVDIEGALMRVASKEGIKVPSEVVARIASGCERNLRRALLQLEATRVQHYPIVAEQAVARADWELFIDSICSLILAKQSTEQLRIIRGKLYELLSNCIPPDLIMRKLAEGLVSKLDTSIKYIVMDTAAKFEHRMQLGAKPIFHLEAFVARFMFLYRQYSERVLQAMMQ